MAQKLRNVGEIESGGAAASYTDTTGAVMDYTAGVANFGAKAAASGSVDLKFWSMVAGVRTLAATVVGAIWTFAGAVRTTGSLFVGGVTSNAKNTLGVTITQGANDDEILSLKSSDVAHGMTTTTETDTYGRVTKRSATSGGVTLGGLTAGQIAVSIDGSATTGAGEKDTTAVAAIEMIARLKSGTTVTTIGANDNLAVIRNGSTTRFIFDSDGDAHADVSWTTF